MIKGIVFDFDGVLVDSVPVKTSAFLALFQEYPEHLAAIKEYHLSNGGIARDKKIKYFFDCLIKKPISEQKLAQLCFEFQQLVEDRVVQADMVAGAEGLLKKCLGRYLMFVASGTPNDEINRIAERRELGRFFSGVFGSPTEKSVILKEIMRANHFKHNELVFIGDAVNDLHAAKQTGVFFIARTDNDEAWLTDPHVSAAFRDLTPVYAFIESLQKEKMVSR